jgi:hypothetical protein
MTLERRLTPSNAPMAPKTKMGNGLPRHAARALKRESVAVATEAARGSREVHK